MTKYPAHLKFIFIIILLAILTWITPFIVEKVMLHREEQMRKREKTVENFSADDFGNVFKDAFKPVTEGITKVIDDITFVFTAVPKLLQGIENHVNCAGQELNDGYTSGLAVLGVLFKCTGQAITNFFNGNCTIYYVLDIIFGTIYKIFVELPIVLLKAVLGLDLQFIVDLIFDIAIEPVDGLIYGLSGYHITRWPDSVVNLCYKCTGKIKGVEITQGYYDWGSMFNCTNAEIEHASKKMFYSIFPVDRHWGTWARGKHLDGWDDATV